MTRWTWAGPLRAAVLWGVVLVSWNAAAEPASAQPANGFGPPATGAADNAAGAAANAAAGTLDPALMLDPAALAAMNAGNFADPNFGGGFGGGFGGSGAGAMNGFGVPGGMGTLPPNTYGTPYAQFARDWRGQYVTYSNPNAPPGMYPVHRMSLHYHAPRDLVYPPPNQPAGVVVYPYYTVRGPTCFFLDDDNTLNR